MAIDSRLMNLVVKDYKPIFEGLGSLVDVGGGTGTVARIISEAFPHMKCTVFDLPHVVANLPDSKNLKFVGGDMFQYIPPADAILFKWILHDWSDEECVNILKNCKEAITKKGKEGKVMVCLHMILELVSVILLLHPQMFTNWLKISGPRVVLSLESLVLLKVDNLLLPL
ncbi:isoflavone 4'-O-methyltransferase-like isoform X7 [Quercus robur]|uniref:isoflavone 4'-O-methyltransferase-like isoform X7 n=1 Tax=Quercus robur TaxID=38942 RepID=UPI002161A005|nr:isoflavone 4'-O-methyltransferase-like isoform X7 [Quercus robur]